MLGLHLQLDSAQHDLSREIWKYTDSESERRLCASFDGTGDYVLCDFFDDMEGSSEWTVSFWAYFNSDPSTTQQIIQHGDNQTGQSQPPFMTINFRYTGGDKLMNFIWTDGNEAMKKSPNDLDFSDSDNQDRWIHVMLTWKKDENGGDVMYMQDANSPSPSYLFGSAGPRYQDSVNNRTTDVPAMNGTENQQKMAIGGFYVDGIGLLTSFDGKIADIAFWNKYFDQQDGHALATVFSPISLYPYNLKHYWPLSDDWEDDGTATSRDDAPGTAYGDASTGNAL